MAADESGNARVIDELHARISSLESELEVSSGYVFEASRMETEFNFSAQSLRDRIRCLEEDVDSCHVSIESLQGANEELSSQNGKLETAINSLNEEVSLLSAQKSDLTVTIDTLRQALIGQEMDVKSYEERLNSATTQLEAMENEIIDLRGKLSAETKLRTDAEASLQSQKHQYTLIFSENKSLEAAIAAADKSNLENCERLAYLECELRASQDLDIKCQKLTTDLEHTQALLSDATSKLDRQEEKKRRDLENLRKQNETIALLQRDHDLEMNSMQSKLEKSMAEATSIRMELDDALLSLSNIAGQVERRDQSIAALEKQLAESHMQLQGKSPIRESLDVRDEISPLSNATPESDGEGDGSFVMLDQCTGTSGVAKNKSVSGYIECNLGLVHTVIRVATAAFRRLYPLRTLLLCGIEFKCWKN